MEYSPTHLWKPQNSARDLKLIPCSYENTSSRQRYSGATHPKIHATVTPTSPNPSAEALVDKLNKRTSYIHGLSNRSAWTFVQWSLNARLEPKVKQLNQRTMTEENSATLYYKISKQGQCAYKYSDSTEQVLLEKLIALLLKKFPASYEALRFITAYTIHHKLFYPTSCKTRFNLVWPSESKSVRSSRPSHALHNPRPHRHCCFDHSKFGTAHHKSMREGRGTGHSFLLC